MNLCVFSKGFFKRVSLCGAAVLLACPQLMNA